MFKDINTKLITEKEASALSKSAELWDIVYDFLSSPLVKNIITMLSFGAVSGKVAQAIKLLQEAESEAKEKKEQEAKKNKKKKRSNLNIVSEWSDEVSDKYVNSLRQCRDKRSLDK